MYDWRVRWDRRYRASKYAVGPSTPTREQLRFNKMALSRLVTQDVLVRVTKDSRQGVRGAKRAGSHPLELVECRTNANSEARSSLFVCLCVCLID